MQGFTKLSLMRSSCSALTALVVTTMTNASAGYADFPAQDCVGIDLSTTGSPGRVISHERLRRGLVHAAAVRELFLWRARAELSAVPRNLRHDLSEENQALEEVRCNHFDSFRPFHVISKAFR